MYAERKSSETRENCFETLFSELYELYENGMYSMSGAQIENAYMIKVQVKNFHWFLEHCMTHSEQKKTG